MTAGEQVELSLGLLVNLLVIGAFLLWKDCPESRVWIVILPLVILCSFLCYLAFLGVRRHHPQQPSQPALEELERQKREAERLRQLEEEKKALR